MFLLYTYVAIQDSFSFQYTISIFFRNVDITGISSEAGLNVSRIESICSVVNEEFGLHEGNPSSSVLDSGSDSETDDTRLVTEFH